MKMNDDLAEDNEDDDETKMEKENDTEKEKQITHEGYLEKQSMHLKKFRKRFIILKGKYLFCYDNHKRTRITELIRLSHFKKAQLSQKKVSQFVLVPISDENEIRVFAAASMDDCDEWISAINQSIIPLPQEAEAIEQKQEAEGKYLLHF